MVFSTLASTVQTRVTMVTRQLSQGTTRIFGGQRAEADTQQNKCTASSPPVVIYEEVKLSASRTYGKTFVRRRDPRALNLGVSPGAQTTARRTP